MLSCRVEEARAASAFSVSLEARLMTHVAVKPCVQTFEQQVARMDRLRIQRPAYEKL